MPRVDYFREPKPESDVHLRLIRVEDETGRAYPFFSSVQLTRWLQTHGHKTNRTCVRHLMRAMALEAIRRKSNLSRPSIAHPVYPFLLHDVIDQSSQQGLGHGHHPSAVVDSLAHPDAMIDWYSKRVLVWELSNTLDLVFYVRTVALADADDGKPEIFSTDQEC